MCASGKLSRPRAGNISQGLHASDLACMPRLGVSVSDNDRQHQLRPTRIWCGLCALGYQRRPAARGISQGLHASAMACAHRLGEIDVGQQQATSADFYTHLAWHVLFLQATSANGRRHWIGHIGSALPASAVACAHCSVVVGCGLPASPLASTQWSTYVERGLLSSPLPYT